MIQVSMPEGAMVLVWSVRRPILHVGDIQNCYEKASFITDNFSAGIWSLFVEVLASVYKSLTS